MKREVIDYGARTNKSMKTWLELIKSQTKISAKEVVYIQENSLTMNQFKVLEVLYHRGNLSIGAITKLTRSTPGNITVVVRNLKRDALVESVVDAQDKRSTLLSLTQAGKKVISGMFDRHAHNLKSYFDALDDEELDTLFTLLRKLQKSQ
ncbi:MarR family transcriptional regulator [bacterium]|nr:MarR family transcriptional regulator [bacterium]MBU1994131.1 MarR family transcriptional regulator [bacterium]